jgi:DNA-directed RNA polymerase alpha subunit
MPLDHSVICEFSFVCNKKWSDLAKIIGISDTRFCTQCAQPVFLTETYKELAEHINAKHCVALASIDQQKTENEFMGLVIPMIQGTESMHSLLTTNLEIDEATLEAIISNGFTSIPSLLDQSSKNLMTAANLSEAQISQIIEALAKLGYALNPD